MNIVDKLDKLIFLSLCGYSLSSCISLETANIFISLMSIFAIIRVIKERPVINIPKQYIMPVLVFFLVMFFLIFFSDDLVAAVRRYWRFASRMIPLIITLAFIKNSRQIKILVAIIILSVTISNIYAIWQGVHGNFRALAFGKDAMDLAGFLVQWLPVMFILSIDKQWCNQRKYIICALILGCAAILFNGTRGAWLALAIIIPLVAFLYYNEKKKVIGYGLVAIFALGIIVHSVPELNSRVATLTDKSFQSNTERILMWKSAWKMFTDHPLTGVGLGTYAHKYQTEYISPMALEPYQGHAHNNFLQMLAETGIIGFISFCYMFGSLLYYSVKDWQQSHDPGSLMFFAATCGIILQGLTEVTFGNRIVMTLYFFTMGLYLQHKYVSK